MNALTGNSLKISRVNIVSKKFQRHSHSGNSVTLKSPNTSVNFQPIRAAITGAADSGETHSTVLPTESARDQLRSDMAASPDVKDGRIAGISAAIRVIPDFPKPGILFQDITTLLLDPKAFKDTIDLFVERYKDKNISVVAGIEARGFIFGPPIALAIGAKFVPMRKPNKLPGEVISEEYSLEYGTDKMEMHVGAVQAGERALVIDDLIATGGTLCAAISLLERVGVHVVECACVIELEYLKDGGGAAIRGEESAAEGGRRVGTG
ncbi:hypothetical protein RJ639_038240 [Escallonia herrerae]|uniref:adenine phosphoribosyltransferase n=1 Tax=Escallonia herrerae TaxID=1293975 RepID=A0AA88WRM5_9ASTE|nr:hypothetical protein RJ639_038240 [Escallonia herrerae]